MNESEFYDPTFEVDCLRCDGSGELLVCVDDICQGIGECIHGDGTIMCPTCQGSGVQP